MEGRCTPMPMLDSSGGPDRVTPLDGEPPTRRAELFAFVVLAVLIWPVIAVGVVGGYGFLVWMFQLVYGPPGPPQ